MHRNSFGTNNKNIKHPKKTISILYVIVILFFVYIAKWLSLDFENTSIHYNTFFSYFLIIGLCSLFSLIAQNIKDKYLSYFILLVAISFAWLPFSLRGIMGTDDPVYQKIFKDVVSYGMIDKFISSTMEPGFLFINQVCSLVSNDYEFCKFICASLPFMIIFFTLVKMRRNLYYVIAILYIVGVPFFIFFEAAIVRMFIAYSIVFYSYKYLLDGNLKKYVTIILLTMLIHYSAGIMLVFTVLLVDNGRFAERPVLSSILIGGSFILVLVFVSFMAANILGARYAAYVMGESESNGFSILSLDTLPFVIYGFFNKTRIPTHYHKFYNILLIILVMSSVISVLSILLPLGRLVFYFNLSIIFLVSFWYKYGHRQLRFAVISVFIFYCFLYAYMTKLSVFDNDLYPYKGILQGLIN